MVVDPQEIETTPWPERDHDLLATGADWTSHAVIGSYKDQTYGRMEGYRRGAEILAEHVLTKDRDLDTVVFQLAACWRHHIELRLKALLGALQQLLALPVEASITTTFKSCGTRCAHCSYVPTPTRRSAI
jgi:hypothetical protein